MSENGDVKKRRILKIKKPDLKKYFTARKRRKVDSSETSITPESESIKSKTELNEADNDAYLVDLDPVDPVEQIKVPIKNGNSLNTLNVSSYALSKDLLTLSNINNGLNDNVFDENFELKSNLNSEVSHPAIENGDFETHETNKKASSKKYFNLQNFFSKLCWFNKSTKKQFTEDNNENKKLKGIENYSFFWMLFPALLMQPQVINSVSLYLSK